MSSNIHQWGVSGTDARPGSTVRVNGEAVPVDARGRFVTPRILPAGDRVITVDIDGQRYRRDVTIPASEWFRVGIIDITANMTNSNIGVIVVIVTRDTSITVVAIAGTMLAMKTNFDPPIGPSRLLFAFEAVIIGGMGNIWGTLAGGIILGVAQAIGAQIDAGYQILAGHLAFLAVLIVRPKGLFAKAKG